MRRATRDSSDGSFRYDSSSAISRAYVDPPSDCGVSKILGTPSNILAFTKARSVSMLILSVAMFACRSLCIPQSLCLYDKYHKQELDATTLEAEIKTLMEDDDVTKKSGIYQYVLSKNEKYLNLRAFTPSQKKSAYERQNGVCPICRKHFEIDEMEADHITPWHEGGKTVPENCQMLCKDCNRHKSGK